MIYFCFEFLFGVEYFVDVFFVLVATNERVFIRRLSCGVMYLLF